MDLGLAGHTILVTGGSRGIGYATAAALVAEGARVTLTGRNPEAVKAAVAALGGPTRGITADNADPDAAERLVQAAADGGRLDGALISVGGPPTSSLLDTSDDAWRLAFESVFLGAIRLARHCISAMADGGAIGLVLSSSVRNPIPHLAISNGLRPGLAMAAKTLADEVGPRGIRVFGLAPGRIATERTAELDRRDPDARARTEQAIPLRRLGRPAEFANVATFLLSAAASYVTGCVIHVDGGMIRGL